MATKLSLLRQESGLLYFHSFGARSELRGHQIQSPLSQKGKLSPGEEERLIQSQKAKKAEQGSNPGCLTLAHLLCARKTINNKMKANLINQN